MVNRKSKEKIKRLKKYVKNKPISIHSLKYALMKKIENGELNSPKEIDEYIEKYENEVRIGKHKDTIKTYNHEEKYAKERYEKKEHITYVNTIENVAKIVENKKINNNIEKPIEKPFTEKTEKIEKINNKKTKEIDEYTEKYENEINIGKNQETVKNYNHKEKYVKERYEKKEPVNKANTLENEVNIKDNKQISNKIDETINNPFTDKMDKRLKIYQKLTKERKFKDSEIKNLNIYHAELLDIHFIYDYIPKYKFDEYKKLNFKLSVQVQEIIKISKEIIQYKKYMDKDNFFTNALLKYIKNICHNYFKNKEGVVLVPVPSSKINKDPQTKQSIIQIVKWYEDKENNIDFEIYNGNGLLKRYKNVPSSKEGEDRSVEKHQNSIECNKNQIPPNKNSGFIILDDITTSGNSLYACKDILIKNGYENKDIICLAIGRTVNVNNELHKSDEGVILKTFPDIVERC